MKKIITCLLAVMLFAPAIGFAQDKMVKISPNPNKSEGVLTLVFKDSTPVAHTVVLISAVADPLVLSQSVIANQISIKLPPLSSGVYLLKLLSYGRLPVTEKLLVYKY
jgi:hypothetical protein